MIVSGAFVRTMADPAYLEKTSLKMAVLGGWEEVRVPET